LYVFLPRSMAPHSSLVDDTETVENNSHYTQLSKKLKGGIGHLSLEKAGFRPLRFQLWITAVITLLLLATTLTSGYAQQQITEKEKTLLAVEQKNHAEYEDSLLKDPDNYPVLLQAARSNLRLAWLAKDKKIRKSHYLKALKQARHAFKLQPDKYSSHQIIGIALAKTIGYANKIRQIGISHKIGEHARFLLSRKTDDPNVWYIYAWWNYELARVKKRDRFFAMVLGGLPKGTTLEKAFEAIYKAIELRPDYTPYIYDAALFYQKTGDLHKAEELYRKVINIPPKTAEDFKFIRQAARRIESLQNR